MVALAGAKERKELWWSEQVVVTEVVTYGNVGERVKRGFGREVEYAVGGSTGVEEVGVGQRW